MRCARPPARLAAALAVALPALLAACAAPRRNPETLKTLYEDGLRRAVPRLELEVEVVATKLPPQPKAYRIGVKDVLDVRVPGRPEFGVRVEGPSNRVVGFRVKPDGAIYVPHVGAVPAAGRTELEVQRDLRARLEKMLEDPQVSVDVLRYASQRFYVLGAVEKPGAFPVDGDATLLDGIGLAGGIEEEGDIERAHVVRGRTLLPISLGDLLLRGDTSRNVVMQDGDLVYVPLASDRKVYLLGEVRKPGPVRIPPRGLTLAAALAEVGGLDPVHADPSEIRIFRGSWQSPRVYTLSAEDVYAHGNDINLRQGDRVHVAPRGLATWSRTVSLLLPFLNAGVTGAASAAAWD